MERTVMTLRLDSSLRLRMRTLARRQGVTPSALVRRAVLAWLDAEQEKARMEPYPRMADLVGCIKGPTDLSVKTSAQARQAGPR